MEKPEKIETVDKIEIIGKIKDWKPREDREDVDTVGDIVANESVHSWENIEARKDGEGIWLK